MTRFLRLFIREGGDASEFSYYLAFMAVVAGMLLTIGGMR